MKKMATTRKGRPQTSYGRKGSALSTTSRASRNRLSPERQAHLHSPERMPKRVEQIVEKKIHAEYNFNRRSKSEKQPSGKTRGSRHHGDENLSEVDLTNSLPEKMMRLSVGQQQKALSRSGSMSPIRRSFEALHNPGDVSPVLIRSHTVSGAKRRDSKAEISNAKLAMMKKKLSPLPDRHQFVSMPSTEDLRDDYSPPLTPK